MLIEDFISDKRKQELEIELASEIYNLKNNIICRQKFIYYISKNYSFIEFCYLYATYIGFKEINRTPINLISAEKSYFEDDIIKIDDYYSDKMKINNNKYRNVKKIKRIENMAQKGKKMKK